MIAIFGGSFNPPTIAHYEVAKHMLKMPFISKLLFVPVGDHYEKAGLVPAFHRAQMLEILAKKLPGASVSNVEIEAKRARKTIETLERLQADHPNELLAFVMGADNLYDLLNWYDYKRLVQNFKFLIVNRHELDVRGFIEENFAGEIENFIFVDDFVGRDISSSKYRASIDHSEVLLPEVEAYIKKSNLY